MTGVGSRFPCGVVEGFYGRPWTHSARLSMIGFLGENGFNTYVYAPKSDPYLRSNWRRVHPRRMREKLAELMRAARQSSVDFVFAMSPGLDMVYSDSSDRLLLEHKLREMTGTECNWVGVFLDDIEPRLVHASDRRRFRSLGEAHVFLLNSILDDLREDGTRLLFCPTFYANDYLGKRAKENEYLKEIGAGLAKGIDVLWTGRKVVSTKISEKDVYEYAQVIRRKPFLWDNYPVNDYYRSMEPSGSRPRLNIGPIEGRAPGVLPLLAGYVSNPMNEPEASKIPLLTLHDYLESPSTYSPQESFSRATRKLFSGNGPYDDVELLADCSRASPLNQREAEGLRNEVNRFIGSFERQRGKEAWPVCTDFAAKLRALLSLEEDLLKRGRNRKLLSEFEPVVEKVKKLAELGLVCLELAQTMREGNQDRAKINHLRSVARREMAKVEANKVQALGEVVFETSTSEVSLPCVRKVSPLLEFCQWSLRASRLRPA